jgi:hypothetical protein
MRQLGRDWNRDGCGMSVRNVFRALATIVVVTTAGVAVAAGSGAVGKQDTTSYDLLAPQVSPSGPIFVHEDLVAGEPRSENFELRNTNKADAQLLISGRTTGLETDLYDALTAKLTDRGDGDVVWEGGLRQLLAGAQAGEIRGTETNKYSVTIGLPDWAGSYYASKRAEFDVNFALAADKNDFDYLAPLTSINTKKSMTRRRIVHELRTGARKRGLRLKYYGTAKDANVGVSRVELSLVRRYTKRRSSRVLKYCSSYIPLRKKFGNTRRGKCKFYWITAKGTDNWGYRFRKMRLKRGAYELRVRSSDRFGNVESKFRRIGDKVNYIRFRVR